MFSSQPLVDPELEDLTPICMLYYVREKPFSERSSRANSLPAVSRAWCSPPAVLSDVWRLTLPCFRTLTPVVERALGKPVAAGEMLSGPVGLMLLQNRNDLFAGEFSLYRVLPWSR